MHLIKKRSNTSPSGLSSTQLKRYRALELLSFPAISRLKDLIQSDNESVALGAIKEVLSRVAPVPKTPVLALQVNNHLSPHLEALKALSVNAAPRFAPTNESQVFDITGGATKPLVKSHKNATISHEDIDVLSNDINAVSKPTKAQT